MTALQAARTVNTTVPTEHLQNLALLQLALVVLALVALALQVV
jgi:hypothetical protein